MYRCVLGATQIARSLWLSKQTLSPGYDPGLSLFTVRVVDHLVAEALVGEDIGGVEVEHHQIDP